MCFSYIIINNIFWLITEEIVSEQIADWLTVTAPTKLKEK